MLDGSHYALPSMETVPQSSSWNSNHHQQQLSSSRKNTNYSRRKQATKFLKSFVSSFFNSITETIIGPPDAGGDNSSSVTQYYNQERLLEEQEDGIHILFLGLDNSGKTTLLHALHHEHNNNMNNGSGDSGSSSVIGRIFPPTERPNQKTFQIQPSQIINDDLICTGYDLGGMEMVRDLWDDYLRDISIDRNANTSTSTGENRRKKWAIFFLVDATMSPNDLGWEEVRDELFNLVHDYGLWDINMQPTTRSSDANHHHHKQEEGQWKENKTEEEVGARGIPLAILFTKCDLETAQSSESIATWLDFDESIEQSIFNYNHDDDNDDESWDQHSHVRMYRTSVWRGEGYQAALQWLADFYEE